MDVLAGHVQCRRKPGYHFKSLLLVNVFADFANHNAQLSLSGHHLRLRRQHNVVTRANQARIRLHEADRFRFRGR
ncbi:hypothetical protein D3C81_1889340 [compost metagenome]